MESWTLQVEEVGRDPEDSEGSIWPGWVGEGTLTCMRALRGGPGGDGPLALVSHLFAASRVGAESLGGMGLRMGDRVKRMRLAESILLCAPPSGQPHRGGKG